EPTLVPVMGLLGVPAHLTSISPTNAHATPVVVREALARYSVWAESSGVDLRDLLAVDLGDIDHPDGPEGEARTTATVSAFPGNLLLALGGDNSITYAVADGVRATGLVTLDAHHDLRDGTSNGSPVQRLIESGLDGRRVVQIGISDFANSPQYASRARNHGITIVHRDEVEARGISAVMADALRLAAGNVDEPRIHVDLDVDACDRSVVPACPAAAPGGLSAYQLRQAARAAGADPRVVSMDLAEVDATADAADGRTVRLVALCVLEAAAGLATRFAPTERHRRPTT
ncbi:MAG: formiminoglutamase, partial [Actinomycetota bacterium]|nr:formiminoglutamase [Actinomycetota bacterium]